MCIFSSDTVVKSTQIFNGVLSPTRRLLSYSNGVTTKKGGSVMMLPIPTSGEVIFHDSTPYKDFLEKISQKVLDEATKGMRGGADLEKFQTVGMYKMLMVKPEDVVSTLVNLRQAVQVWTYDMVDSYVGYQWLFVVIPEGKEISSQPILIEFEQTVRPHDLYFPMMDVHGDDQVSSFVPRKHIISIGDPTFTEENGNFKLDLPTFPWDGKFGFFGQTLGIVENNRWENGDLWATPDNSGAETEWSLGFETPYPLPV